MISLGSTLDTIIAVVIVLLILSLVVQSVQQALKKIFKIKSRQIEDSLVDLFEHILNEPPPQIKSLSERFVQSSPFVRMFIGQHPAERNQKVKDLYVEVKKKFEEAGRISQRGKLMLDSIAKQDLMRVLGSIAPSIVIPDFASRLENVKAQFINLEEVFNQFTPSNFSSLLSSETREKLAQMQGALRPLVNDLRAYIERLSAPQSPPSSPPDAVSGSILNDIAKLRTIRLEDISKLLNEAQQAVERDLAKAQQDSHGTAAATVLQTGADALAELAAGLNSLDLMIDQLLANITKAETWFDTVMQSFEERYARSMKTWGLVISFAVVLVLNANFFEVYKNIAGNDTLRANLVQMRDDLAKRYAESAVKDDEQEAAKTLQKLYDDTARQVGDNARLYTNLGFTPSWKSHFDWSPEVIVNSLLGWTIMALLLSAGAPFWQDTLESLFGLKNVLRKQSDTKNVENKGGQPKP